MSLTRLECATCIDTDYREEPGHNCPDCEDGMETDDGSLAFALRQALGHTVSRWGETRYRSEQRHGYSVEWIRVAQARSNTTALEDELDALQPDDPEVVHKAAAIMRRAVNPDLAAAFKWASDRCGFWYA